MKGYRFVEGITQADVAFEAAGKTASELFAHAARALFEIQVDTTTVKPKITRSIEVSAPSLEGLLFNFLEELIFVKDRDGMLFSEWTVRVTEGKEWRAAAELKGDVIDHARQKLRVDAKAVTMHHFRVEKTKKGYTALVVIDI